jgi:hypothetical protein
MHCTVVEELGMFGLVKKFSCVFTMKGWRAVPTDIDT